jgi:hypothetical protein
MSSAKKPQEPLEALVASQLGAIRKQEAALHRRLQSNGSREARNISTDLRKLQITADRLDRMVDAMGLRESYGQAFVGVQTAA